MFEIIEWSEISNLIKDNFNIIYTKKKGKPDLFGEEGKIWNQVFDYEDLENIDVLRILEKKKNFEGDLYIITHESHSKNLGAFKVNSSNIHKFIETYCEKFGGYFVDHDLLIFNFEEKILWVYHHSNFYEVLDFKNR